MLEHLSFYLCRSDVMHNQILCEQHRLHALPFYLLLNIQFAYLYNSDSLIFKKCNNPEVSVGENIHFGVRPEHFIFTKNQTQKINGKVYAVERLGGETYIYLNSKTENDIIVHCSGDREIKVGENLDVGFSIKDCHLFNSNGWTINK